MSHGHPSPARKHRVALAVIVALGALVPLAAASTGSGPVTVFVAAGKSGGIEANRRYPADLMVDNLLTATHLCTAALRHGTIWINDYHPYVAAAEWGGYKQSGVGRELGHAGFAEYLEHKHIWRNLAPAPSGWFPKGQ